MVKLGAGIGIGIGFGIGIGIATVLEMVVIDPCFHSFCVCLSLFYWILMISGVSLPYERHVS